MKWVEHDGRYWRVNAVSCIERHWLRRLALVAAFPIFLAWQMAIWAFITAITMLATPFVMAEHYWPRELWRTTALRWSAPKPKGTPPAPEGE